MATLISISVMAINIKRILICLLNPLSFFRRQPSTNATKFILKIINNHCTFINCIFWLIQCVCEMHLVCDMAFGLRVLIIKFWRFDNIPDFSSWKIYINKQYQIVWATSFKKIYNIIVRSHISYAYYIVQPIIWVWWNRMMNNLKYSITHEIYYSS